MYHVCYTAGMASIITTTNLSVVLGKHFPALKHVSIELPRGAITGLIGPSGAGKTTLIRTIVGRQKATKGRVMVLGQVAGSKGLRSRLSYMTQEISIYEDLSVQENIVYFANMTGRFGKTAKAAAAEVLAAVDMTDKAPVLVRDLSGGQKQRVSLAVALIGEPELLVLDEPTVGLDPVLREQLWALFRRLCKEGKTIIISSHVMDEAERCDDLLLIRGGEVVAHGSPRELCERTGTKTVEQSFLALAGGNK
jgi:ABC-2 type transport system ATP-binding protein